MRSITVFLLILVNVSFSNKAYNQDFRKYVKSDTYSRGILCVDQYIYTSNANGTLSRFTWESSVNTTYFIGKGELRDLVVKGNQLLAMESGEKGIILRKTEEKTDTLSQLFAIAPTVFFDGMDNYNSTLFVMGDPINGFFSLFYSTDFGQTWNKIDGPAAKEGEAGFAASGTNVQVLDDSTFIFVSGGKTSRFFKSTDRGKNWTVADLPFPTGSHSTGAFSIHMKNREFGIVVGGNYESPKDSLLNCFITEDGGKSWKTPIQNPNGYRSCVIEKNGIWYCCGTSGLDYSLDNGANWTTLSENEFFALATDNQYIYATARKGFIHRFNLMKL